MLTRYIVHHALHIVNTLLQEFRSFFVTLTLQL
nr:MAG TPA: hypothetical protein [Caudoviricetes sp.]